MNARTIEIVRVCLALVTIMLFAASSYGEIDPGTIVGAWLLDDGSGDTAEDSSGNGKDGEVVGDAKWVDGKFGKAIEFNGTNVWVNVPEIEPLAEVSIVKWFNMTGKVGAWRSFFNHCYYSEI